jgi:bifunctional DNase/RNase
MINAIARISVIGLVLVAGVTASSRSSGAPARPETPAPRMGGLQEVDVIAVVMDQRTQTPTVILQGKRDKRTFGMAIGVAEATGIALPLQGVTPLRPLTHDLFLTLFGRLKVGLTRVVITDLRDNVYYATVHLTAGTTEMTLDSRPSDAIALAIRSKVPVLVEDRVFDKSVDEAPNRPRI